MKRPPEHKKAEPTLNLKLAKRDPVGDSEELDSWWRPYINKNINYRAYKVRVCEFIDVDSTVMLKFHLIRHPEQKELTVDLYGDLSAAWPTLPSTVMYAKKNQYAFLLLTDEWLKSEGIAKPKDYAEAGEKWPFGAETLTRNGMSAGEKG